MPFLDTLSSFSLQQHVIGATQLHGHTLDLFITRESEEVIAGSPRIDRFISDHAAIFCKLVSSKPQLLVRSISYRKMKSINLDRLKNDIKD